MINEKFERSPQIDTIRPPPNERLLRAISVLLAGRVVTVKKEKRKKLWKSLAAVVLLILFEDKNDREGCAPFDRHTNDIRHDEIRDKGNKE